MKEKVLWLGDAMYCRALMKVYSKSIDSFYAEKISAGFLKKHSGKFTAVVLVTARGRYADPELCRVLLGFSAANRFPVLFVGQRRQLRAAAVMCPYAMLYRIDEARLINEIRKTERTPRPKSRGAVVVFAEEPEYYAYCEEKAEEAGLSRLRMIYTKPAAGIGEWLAGTGSELRLLIFCGRSASEAGIRTVGLKNVPFVTVYASEEPPSTGDFEPIAAIDMESGGDELPRCLADAEKGRV